MTLERVLKKIEGENNMRENVKKNMRKILITTIVILGLYISTNGVIAAIGPSFELDPEEPNPKSTVMFTVTIPDSENISNVRLIVKECKGGDICFTDSFNESMTKKDVDTFELEITLKHDTATYIEYYVGYLNNDIWEEVDSEKLNLKIESNNGNSNGNGDTNGTPGFEIIPFLAAISIGILLFRRKRF